MCMYIYNLRFLSIEASLQPIPSSDLWCASWAFNSWRKYSLPQVEKLFKSKIKLFYYNFERSSGQDSSPWPFTWKSAQQIKWLLLSLHQDKILPNVPKDNIYIKYWKSVVIKIKVICNWNLSKRAETLEKNYFI